MKPRFLAAVLAAAVQLQLVAEEPAPAAPQPKPKAAAVSFSDIGLVEFEASPDPKWAIRYTLNGSDPKANSYAYCTPIRVASALKIKAACFGPDGKCGAAVQVECLQKPAEEKAQPAKLTGAINVDFSETPELAAWALRAQKDAEEYYPVIAEKLGGEGFTPPRQVMFVFLKDMKGIAATGGDTVKFAKVWIDAHPDDTGTVIHELTHVIQAYRAAPRGTGWLIEGIADYIRWWCWEPPEHRGRIDPARVKFKDTYQTAAAFLYWAEKQYDKDLVRKVNQHIRDSSYKDELFKELTGKDLAAIWKEWVESLAKPKNP